MSAIKSVKLTHGQKFWYVEVKRDGQTSYKQDSRWADFNDAVAHVRNLLRGGVA